MDNNIMTPAAVTLTAIQQTTAASKRWIIIDMCNGSWHETVTNASTREQAIEAAERYAAHLTEREIKRRESIIVVFIEFNGGEYDLDSAADIIEVI